MTDPVDRDDIRAEFPLAELSSFETGENVLFVGEPGTGRRSLGLRLLADGTRHGQGALVIVFRDDVETVLEDYRTSAGGDGLSSLTVIDCTGTDQVPADLPENQYFSVDSPSSLTDIGMSFIEYQDTHADWFDGTRVLVDSITTLLEHVTEDRAFEFINAFIGRFTTARFQGVWTMDASAHDEQTLSTFRELFDRVVELRQADGERQYRIRDRSGDTSEWTAFSDG